MFVYMSVISKDASLVLAVIVISWRSFINCTELFTLKVKGSGTNLKLSHATERIHTINVN
jgi:hypothetical protein